MKYNKKTRTKQRNEENGGLKLEIVDGEKRKDGRKRSGEKYKLDQQGGEKKGKKELNKSKEPIVRSDSPGIDLSIFEPRGKRRCVIQNELKKQRDGVTWWSDGEEEEEEIESDGERIAEADTRRKKEDKEVEQEIVDDEDEEEIEEEIIDDDEDEEEEEEEEDEDDKPLKPKKKQPTNKVSNGVAKTEDIPSKPENNGVGVVVETSSRYFVFSTAMANRAGHAVSKGLHDSISKYHAAQKWETPYLSAEIHCRPFIAELEDKIIEDELKEKELFEKQLRAEEAAKKAQRPNGKIQKAESFDSQQYEISLKKEDDSVEHKDRTLSVDSWQKEQVIQAAQRMGRVSNKQQQQQQQHLKVKTEESPQPQQQQQQQKQQQLQQQQPSPNEINKNSSSPLHPRFHLCNPNQNSNSNFVSIQPLSNSTDIKMTVPAISTTTTTTINNNSSRSRSPIYRPQSPPHYKLPSKTRDPVVNGVLPTNSLPVSSVPVSLKEHRSNSSPDLHSVNNINNKNEKTHLSNTAPPRLVSSLPPQVSHSDERRRSVDPVIPKSSSYPADITNVKMQLRYQSPKDFSLDKLISKSKEDMNVRPTVISMPSGLTATENVRSTIDIAEKHLKEGRFHHSPPILPRDIRSSAFVSTRDSIHLRPPSFKAGFGGIPPPTSLPPSASENPLFHSRLHQLHKLHSSSFSPVTSHHYQHPREAIENIIDFSARNPALPTTPVRPAVSRTNGYADSKAFSENYKPLISSFSTAHRKDRPSSLPVPDMYSRSEKKLSTHNPFSVETLTKPHVSSNRNEKRVPDENSHHIERRYPPPHHQRPFHDRVLPPSHDGHVPTHERLHIPNGVNSLNGLKRTLDEQLSNNISRVENERKYLEIHEDWRRKEKERLVIPSEAERLEKDRIFLEKERLLRSQPPPPSFRPDHRSPLHIPAYLARLPNGNGISRPNEAAISPHAMYSHVRRVAPYPGTNKFPHS